MKDNAKDSNTFFNDVLKMLCAVIMFLSMKQFKTFTKINSKITVQYKVNINITYLKNKNKNTFQKYNHRIRV